MSYVTAMGFQVDTKDWPDAGTDSRVDVVVIRDDLELETRWIERGNTPRLDRGDRNFYHFRFSKVYWDPPGLGHSTGSEQGRLPGVEFANGVHGHLVCQFRIRGDDAWIKDRIVCKVKYSHLEHIPNTIDSFRWVEDRHWTTIGTFDDDIKMSTDSNDGSSNYPAYGALNLTF